MSERKRGRPFQFGAQLTIRLTPELLERIKAHAEREGSTTADVARRAIEDRMQEAQ